MNIDDRGGYLVQFFLVLVIIGIVSWIAIGAWYGKLGLKNPDRKLATLFGLTGLIIFAGFIWALIEAIKAGLLDF